MGILPDLPTLAKRLRKPAYSRMVPRQDQFLGQGVEAFFEFLRGRCATLTDTDIAASLADYLAPDKIPGLALSIRAELAKLRL